MKKSTFFAKELKEYYIGMIVLHPCGCPKSFKHALRRIYDSRYVIPNKYIGCVAKYGIPKLELENNYNLIEIMAVGEKRYITVSDILRSSVLRKQLEQNDCLTVRIYNTKIFQSIYYYFDTGNGLNNIPKDTCLALGVQ